MALLLRKGYVTVSRQSWTHLPLAVRTMLDHKTVVEGHEMLERVVSNVPDTAGIVADGPVKRLHWGRDGCCQVHLNGTVNLAESGILADMLRCTGTDE